MQPNPLINPYNQATATLMQGLLAETKNRFAIDPNRLAYVFSEIPRPEADPETAFAHYRDTRHGPDGVTIPLQYQRLHIDVYVNFYPVHLRFLPWMDREFTDTELLAYVSQNLGALLLLEDVTIVRGEVQSSPVAQQKLYIQPNQLHPIWYGALELWVVNENDLRGVITHRHYPQFDPTALS